MENRIDFRRRIGLRLLMLALPYAALPARANILTSEERMKDHMIEIALKSLPESLDPRTLVLQHHTLITQSLFQTLIRLNEEGRIVGDLADTWKVAPDGRTITFLLKRTLFHDGKSVTSTDAKFSLSRHIWPSSKSPAQGYLRMVIEGADQTPEGGSPVGIQAPDPTTLVIHLKEPYPPFLFVLAMPSFAIMSEKKMVDEGVPMGSGPMRLALFTRDHVTLERNDAYAGPRPRAVRINIRAVSSGQEMLNEVRRGQLDVAMIGVNNRLDVGQLPTGFEETRSDTLGFTHLFCNTGHSLLADEAFRTDLSALIAEYLATNAPKAEVQTPTPQFFPRGIMPPGYYEARSSPRLSAADFRQRWQSKTAGKPIRLVVNPDVLPPEFINGLQSVLTNAGIITSVEQLNGEGLMRRAFEKSYDIIAGSYVGNFPDPDGMIDPLLGSSGWSFGAFDVSELKNELVSARFDMSPQNRLTRYSTAMRRFESRHLVIPFFRERFRIVHNDKIRIPESNLRYESELWNIMWVEK